MIKPSTKIEMTPLDWVIEIITGLILIVGLIYIAINFSTLPDTIPTHFGLNGQPDGYGSKYTLILLVLIGISTYILLTLSHKWTNLINYPFEITPETEERQFQNAFLMIRVLKLFTTLLLGSIIYGTFQTAIGHARGLGYLTEVILVLMLLFMGLFIYRGYRIKNHSN